VYQSLIQGLEVARNEVHQQADKSVDIALSEINTDTLINQANQLADHFINLGYINGAVKDSVVSRLQELDNQLQQHYKYLE